MLKNTIRLCLACKYYCNPRLPEKVKKIKNQIKVLFIRETPYKFIRIQFYLELVCTRLEIQNKCFKDSLFINKGNIV